jgi:hypothetical protein
LDVFIDAATPAAPATAEKPPSTPVVANE